MSNFGVAKWLKNMKHHFNFRPRFLFPLCFLIPLLFLSYSMVLEKKAFSIRGSKFVRGFNLEKFSRANVTMDVDSEKETGIAWTSSVAQKMKSETKIYSKEGFVERRESEIVENLNREDRKKDFDLVLEKNYESKNESKVQNASERIPFDFKLTTLTLDPSERDSGFPLTFFGWNSTNVFVVDIENSKRISKSLAKLDGFLSDIGIQYTRVLAPQDLSESFLLKYHPVRSLVRYERRCKLKPHELKFALAHYELWTRIRFQNLKFALIFEFDAFFSEGKANFSHRFQEALKQLNLINVQDKNGMGFDIFLLSHRPLHAFGEYALTRDIIRAQPSLGTHAYIISSRGIIKLLKQSTLDRPVNEMIWSVPNLKILALKPTLGKDLNLFTCKNKPCRDLPPKQMNWFGFLKSQRRLIDLGNTFDSKQFESFKVNSGRSHGQGLYHKNGRMESKYDCTLAQCFIKYEREKMGNELDKKNESSFELQRTNCEISARLKRRDRVMPSSLHEWRVYVINLKQDVKRFSTMIRCMEKLGFGDVVRSEAINANHVAWEPFTHLIAKERLSASRAIPNSTNRNSTLTGGEIGCALSHYMVWVEMLKLEMPYAIVLEDDLRFVENFKILFEKRVQEANAIIREGGFAFDVLYLGRTRTTSSFYEPSLSRFVVQAAMSWSTCGYIVSLCGAKKLVRGFYINDPVDLVWWKVPGVRFWAFQPVLVNDRSNENENENENENFVSRTRS